MRAVLFDAVGTLIRPEPSVGVAYAAAAARQGINLPADEVQARFRKAFAAEEFADRHSGQGRTSHEREVQRWRCIVAAVFPGARDPEALFADLWDHFADAANWRLFADVPPVLARLRAEVDWVGVASNFDQRLHAICQHIPPLSQLAPVIVSAEVGWRKPCQQFFAAAAAALSVAPSEILLVGDDLENDYRAAVAAGWQAVWLDRQPGTQPLREPPALADRAITQLSELRW
ncbi:MAG: HAD-IA family hydrolase [Planctomycetaceae bacterium]|nr:HAD-IA family hydrolase [Planctomycetaceae bacterium]